MAKVRAADLICDAINNDIGKDEFLRTICIIGSAVDQMTDLGLDVDLDDVWAKAEEMYDGRVPDFFCEFMEKVYGYEGHSWDISPELGDELRSIIDSFEWKD